MKKFLPLSERSESKGFTLVELLVVIAIIAILATIGFTVFSGTGAKARDAKRKADIGQIANAYEVNYNQNTGAYAALADGQFTAGDTPSPPESPTGTYTYVVGPNAASPSTATYTVCATLEGGTAGCTAPSDTCFCRSAAQASTTTTAAAPCSRFNNLTVGQSQSCDYFSGTILSNNTYYVKCADLTANWNCAAVCQSMPSGAATNLPVYSSSSATSQSGTTVFASSACSGTPSTLILRGP